LSSQNQNKKKTKKKAFQQHPQHRVQLSWGTRRIACPKRFHESERSHPKKNIYKLPPASETIASTRNNKNSSLKRQQQQQMLLNNWLGEKETWPNFSW